MNENYFRDEIMSTMANELAKFQLNYMAIYDYFYSLDEKDENKYIASEIKDFADVLLHINALLTVYARDKKLDSVYALEKLDRIDSYVKSMIEFFKESEK